MIRLFDGARQPLPAESEPLLSIYSGSRQLFRDFRRGAEIPCFFEDPLDLRVIVHVNNYRDSGFAPVPMTSGAWTQLDLMLLRRGGDLNFAQARWANLKPEWKAFMGPRADYEAALEERPKALATMLNVVAAAENLGLIGHIRSAEWDSLRNDRFFCWVEPEFVEWVSRSPRFKPSPVGSHIGATRTFKQIDFNEANIQFSLHEKTPAPPGLEGRVRVECDMDYYKNQGAHLLLEVLPNRLTGSRTNPAIVYMLRWMAARRAGYPDFAPPYVFV